MSGHWQKPIFEPLWGGGNCSLKRALSLVALYRAMRVWFEYRFESCDANDPRNVKTHKPCETKARFFLQLLPDGSQELVLKVATREVHSRCDSCEIFTLRFGCPRSTRAMDGIAGRLLAMQNCWRSWDPECLLQGSETSKLPKMQEVCWPSGEMVSQESLAPVQPCFAPVQPFLAPVQQAFGPHTFCTLS